ncbi:MAG: hypothetical protein PHX52_02150 [Candidatus Pacebacteria bacterium]|nr:hypothetical protein [Candidatus Paceibacterota bacterium]MDD3919366.1 hypothetical protein [Candidatus Paceibacterota bacterium]
MFKKIIIWSPRILAIAFILFLSLFALDVFNEYEGWFIVVPLLIHLLPALILLSLTIVAFRFDLIGMLGFISFSIFYILLVGFSQIFMIILAPAVIISLLFLLSWFYKKKRG